ncbi:hypothetical protein N7522_012897 [Penicillium canescens]|nr:hypothetical protein N7522_012897 [Penicillium canescens]
MFALETGNRTLSRVDRHQRNQHCQLRRQRLANPNNRRRLRRHHQRQRHRRDGPVLQGRFPRKYDNDCGIYCLAQGQDIGTLQSCITSKSGNYHDVFCNTSRQNATATAAATKASSTSSGTTGTSTSTSTHNAAVANQPVSKSGLGLVALMFGSAFMAAFS